MHTVFSSPLFFPSSLAFLFHPKTDSASLSSFDSALFSRCLLLSRNPTSSPRYLLQSLLVPQRGYVYLSYCLSYSYCLQIRLLQNIVNWQKFLLQLCFVFSPLFYSPTPVSAESWSREGRKPNTHHSCHHHDITAIYHELPHHRCPPVFDSQQFCSGSKIRWVHHILSFFSVFPSCVGVQLSFVSSWEIKGRSACYVYPPLPLTLTFCLELLYTRTLTSSSMIHCLWKEIVYENQRNRNRESVCNSICRCFSLKTFLSLSFSCQSCVGVE